MRLRRAFFWWMFPAAFVLPLWLFVGSIVFDAGAWGLVWALFLAIPSVFLGQLILALLVRARGTVRAARAVSWWDVLGFGVWHALIVTTGLFLPGWFALTLVVAALAAVGLFWLTLWQLWREAAGGVRTVLRAADGTAYLPPEGTRRAQPADAEVIVITERPTSS